MLTCLLAALFCAPASSPAQDNSPEKVLTLACERNPMAVGAIKILYSPDGKLLVCDGKEGIELWELPEGKRRGTLPIQSPAVAVSPDGRFLATAVNEPASELQLWDAESCKLLRSAKTDSFTPGSGMWRFFLAFNGDGTRVAALTLDNVSVFATSNLQRLDKFAFTAGTLVAHPDGKTLILTPRDRSLEQTIYVDFKTGKPRRSPLHGGGQVDALAISQDGSVLATVSYIGTRPKCKSVLKVWDSKKQSELWSQPREWVDSMSFDYVQFSPDAWIVGSICSDPDPRDGPYLHLWTVRVPTPLWPEWTKGLKAKSFTFSPDGKGIAVVQADSVSVWKLP